MLGWMLTASAEASRTSSLHNFYGWHPKVATQQEFVHMLDSRQLKLSRERLVGLYNQQYAALTGPAQDFDMLLNILSSGDFTVDWCKGGVVAFGFYDSGAFDALSRECYAGERVLVHRRSGIAVFSLTCGNLLMPPRVAYRAPCYSGGSLHTNKAGPAILWGARDMQYGWDEVVCPNPYAPLTSSGHIPRHD
jgi:hypothetical protein